LVSFNIFALTLLLFKSAMKWLPKAVYKNTPNT
jgi:hypothetical protein